MGKFKKGIIIAIVCMVCVAIVACNNNNNEEEDTVAVDSTTPTDNDSEDSNDKTEETEQVNYEEEDDYEEDYDYSEDEEDKDEPLTTSDKLESKLEEIADEVAIDVDANDYKVTYQYEPENDTGYIFITWLGANDASKSDVKTMLEVSGFKDVMQEIANYTAEELQEISAKGKQISGCVVLRDMSNKQLYSCVSE